MDVQQIHRVPSTNVYINVSARTSENLDSNTLGNTEESQRVDEIFINYTNYGESFNRKTTIIDINFYSKIAIGLQPDPENKSMAECIRLDQMKGNNQDRIALAKKREVFSSVIPTPRNIFPIGPKWVFIHKRIETMRW
jgi:hypothetical protein